MQKTVNVFHEATAKRFTLPKTRTWQKREPVPIPCFVNLKTLADTDSQNCDTATQLQQQLSERLSHTVPLKNTILSKSKSKERRASVNHATEFDVEVAVREQVPRQVELNQRLARTDDAKTFFTQKSYSTGRGWTTTDQASQYDTLLSPRTSKD